jgi:hypothetical protein
VDPQSACVFYGYLKNSIAAVQPSGVVTLFPIFFTAFHAVLLSLNPGLSGWRAFGLSGFRDFILISPEQLENQTAKSKKLHGHFSIASDCFREGTP